MAAAVSLSPLVLLQALLFGIIIIFATHQVWLLIVEIMLLTIVYYVLRIPLSHRERWGLVVGAILWAVLAFINDPHNRWSSAFWDGTRFGAVLSFSLAILKLRPPIHMILYLEKALKKFIGPKPLIGQMSLMALLVMRYIPELRLSAQRVNTDVRMRRQLVGERGQWKDVLRFLTPLIMISILRSDYIAESIWARGWRPHHFPQVAPWTLRDTITTVIMWVIFLITWKVLI
ncbi:energy-coupling factor transporter transmembrane component T [Sulfobacillus thermosulfidooxidans]|uniref:energy-coupling factor transporter transmembrane component T n=1 Tax=Sulfobacillus thermosulfidooxidans TaxID=28034 RepID=UPI0006B4D9DD|nr:energy-coupling factor transporter transmembrane component T [Sulfobacillus thermosulfidooxidans]